MDSGDKDLWTLYLEEFILKLTKPVLSETMVLESFRIQVTI